MNNFFSLCTSLQAHRRLLFSLPSFTVSFPFFLYSITMQSRSIVIKSLSHLVRVSGRFSYLQESQTRRKSRLLVSDWEEEQLRRNLSHSLSYTHTFLPPTPVYNLPSHTHSTTNPPLSSNNKVSVTPFSLVCSFPAAPPPHNLSLLKLQIHHSYLTESQDSCVSIQEFYNRELKVARGAVTTQTLI